MNDQRDDREGDAARGGNPYRREAARTTIVGGQPDGNARELPPIPVGLEHLMGLAAASPEFAEALGRDRKAALAATGLELSRSERGILEAVPTPALAQMVSRVGARLDAPDRRRFLEQAGLALAVLLGASMAAGAGCKKKPAPSQSEQQEDPPARDQPGAPEGDRPAQGRGIDAGNPANASPDASTTAATPDAAAARPSEVGPGRPASSDTASPPTAVPPTTDAPSRPRLRPPPSVDSLRPRPDRPPLTKGIRPDRDLFLDDPLPKSRGISPDRRR